MKKTAWEALLNGFMISKAWGSERGSENNPPRVPPNPGEEGKEKLRFTVLARDMLERNSRRLSEKKTTAQPRKGELSAKPTITRTINPPLRTRGFFFSFFFFLKKRHIEKDPRTYGDLSTDAGQSTPPR